MPGTLVWNDDDLRVTYELLGIAANCPGDLSSVCAEHDVDSIGHGSCHHEWLSQKIVCPKAHFFNVRCALLADGNRRRVNDYLILAWSHTIKSKHSFGIRLRRTERWHRANRCGPQHN